MPKVIKVGDCVELKRDTDGHFRGDWGKVVLIDDGEYHVAMFGDERDCPIFLRNEIKLMPKYEKESVIVEAIELHDTLNPKIWNTETMSLKPDVRQKVLEIVEEFTDNVKDMADIELNPLDIYLVGSNASYNYTDKSDLDVHMVINFDTIDDNKGLVQSLMNFQKSEFNTGYDITIHDIDVEMYVEDINSSTMSNGIYSVMSDQWIKKPEPIEVPEIDIEDKIDEWKEKINEALDSKDTSAISKMIDDLYILRKNGLLATGEYGEENQTFKEIRNLGLLGELKDSYMELKSKELSLEGRRVNNRMVRFVEDFEEEFAYESAGKYDVSSYDGSFSEKTDDPREAVRLWFKHSRKYPLDIAIYTRGKENVWAFYDALDDKFIENLYNRYEVPYKLDWLLNSIHKGQDGKISGFYDEDMLDQIDPFCFG